MDNLICCCAATLFYITDAYAEGLDRDLKLVEELTDARKDLWHQTRLRAQGLIPDLPAPVTTHHVVGLVKLSPAALGVYEQYLPQAQAHNLPDLRGLV